MYLHGEFYYGLTVQTGIMFIDKVGFYHRAVFQPNVPRGRNTLHCRTDAGDIFSTFAESVPD